MQLLSKPFPHQSHCICFSDCIRAYLAVYQFFFSLSLFRVQRQLQRLSTSFMTQGCVFALGHLRTFQAKLKSTTLMWLERISISQSIRFRICEFPTDLCLKELSNIGVLLKWATTDPACYSDYCVPLCLVVSCSHTCISFSCRKP